MTLPSEKFLFLGVNDDSDYDTDVYYGQTGLETGRVDG